MGWKRPASLAGDFPPPGRRGFRRTPRYAPPQFVCAVAIRPDGLCARLSSAPTVCVRCRHLPRPVVCAAISVVCGPHQGMYAIASLMYFSARHLAGETLSDLNRRRLPSVHNLLGSAHNWRRAATTAHTTGGGRRWQCTQPRRAVTAVHTNRLHLRLPPPSQHAHPRIANLWSDCAGRLRVLSAFLRRGGTSGITESERTEPSREGGKNV